ALETRDAVNAVREASGILKALSGTVSQAERLLALSEKGFEYGVKTHLEVQDAELNLRQARGNLARARRDYLVARVTLDYVTGALAEGPGGTWAGEAPWRPAKSALGIVPEVLKGEPRLSR
ncbi:MAG: TolC family protein, partial [Deltaproteobacteria bacterium]|nr:TolC family protein [Deltaproteobacteria bacterium]